MYQPRVLQGCALKKIGEPSALKLYLECPAYDLYEKSAIF